MAKQPIKRILVANRGEIAVRIMRTCHERGMETVAVYSEADRMALHTRTAHRAECIGPAPSRQSYLDVTRILDAAKRHGVDAIHPGYGFLSESAAFAQACQDAGFIFIGPPASAIHAMGDKTRARAVMRAAGVPVVPGSDGAVTEDGGEIFAREVGLPVMVKAAAGGGGKGMRKVTRWEDLRESMAAARREAAAAFGDGSIYIEKYLERPRHVEIQVFADHHGTTHHLFERECSIQRRHQKIIEESPSPGVDADLRARMGEVAIRAATAVGYVNAGTVEFLLDKDRRFYFLEMNTRLQVEHPVTEWVTGLDLVAAQLDVAMGLPLPWKQQPSAPRGHAVEARIYAEDPAQEFLPRPGRILDLKVPGGPGVRCDTGVYAGAEVSPFYDPLIAKLSSAALNRTGAISKLVRALREFHVKGLRNNIAFLVDILEHPVFRSGDVDTGFLEVHMEARAEGDLDVAALLAAAVYRLEEDRRSAARVVVPAPVTRPQGMGAWQRTFAPGR